MFYDKAVMVDRVNRHWTFWMARGIVRHEESDGRPTMDYQNVPSLKSVLLGAALWMVALAVLAASAAFAAGSTAEIVRLGLVSGVCLVASLGFAKYALIDLDKGVAVRIRNTGMGVGLVRKIASRRSAKAA